MANENQVTVVIGAEDKFTDVIKKFEDAVQGGTQKAKTGFENATAASKKFTEGLAIVGTAVVAFGVEAIRQAEAQMVVNRQTEAVLTSTKSAAGLTKEAVLSLADSLSTQTNFTNEAVQSAENMLLTFTNIHKDVFPAATETVLNMAQALGEDTKSASIQLGKALQDPILGITALRRVGVNFTDDQKKVIKSLVDTGRTADAQKVILSELATEFGGSAKAAADPMVRLQHLVEEITKAFGMMMLPAVEAVTNKIIDFMDSMGGANEIAAKIVSTLQNFEPYLPIITGMIIGGLVPAFMAWGGTLLFTTIPALVAATVALAPFIIAGGVVASVALIIYKAWQGNWFGIRDMLGPTITTIVGYFSVLAKVIQDQGGFLQALQNGWERFVLHVQQIWQIITLTVSSFFQNVSNTFASWRIDFEVAWGSAWNGAASALENILNGIKTFFSDWYNTILGWVTDILTKVGLVSTGAANAHTATASSASHKPAGHAFGGMVQGDSGLDNIPIMASAGEVVLNAAMQNNVASNLKGSGGSTSIVIDFSKANFYGDDKNFAKKIGDQIIQALDPQIRFRAY